MIFDVPVRWEVSTYLQIEAETPEEAKRIAEELDRATGGDYVIGTYEVGEPYEAEE